MIAMRRIARHFTAAGAVRKADAIAYSPGHFIRRRAFAHMQGKDIVKPGAKGTWYLDLPAYEEYRATLRKRALAIAGTALVAGVAIAIIR